MSHDDMLRQIAGFVKDSMPVQVSLPAAANSLVPVDCAVAGDQFELSADRLSDQQAVERVLV